MATANPPAQAPLVVTRIIDAVIGIEGGFVDDPKDSGGATRWGVTERVARKWGYTGAMRDLPRAEAFAILLKNYYRGPRFHLVEPLSGKVAEELFEIEVNLPPGRAAGFLQRALNGLNDPLGRQGKGAKLLYPDVQVDGHIGKESLDALAAYLKFRGHEGEQVLLRLLNSQQACYYLDRAEARPENERFLYGWILNRAKIA